MAGLIFSSCEKDTHLEKQTVSNDMISFASVEEYTTELNKIMTMSLDELEAYEAQKGYHSLGLGAEKFYQSIDFESFHSKEELLDFVANHPEYLQTMDDGNGEIEIESKFYNFPQRYFANTNQMFEIENTTFKILENGIASCPSENMYMLEQITDENIDAFDTEDSLVKFAKLATDNSYGLKDGTYNCGTSKTARATSGRNRTKLQLSISFLNTYAYVFQNGQEIKVPQTILNNRVLIRPYKRTMGVWYWCSRTINCNIKVAVDKKINNTWIRDTYAKSVSNKKTSKLEFPIEGGVVSMGYHTTIPMHYGGIDSWADTPSTSPARIQCNTSIAN